MFSNLFNLRTFFKTLDPAPNVLPLAKIINKVFVCHATYLHKEIQAIDIFR